MATIQSLPSTVRYSRRPIGTPGLCRSTPRPESRDHKLSPSAGITQRGIQSQEPIEKWTVTVIDGPFRDKFPAHSSIDPAVKEQHVMESRLVVHCARVELTSTRRRLACCHDPCNCSKGWGQAQYQGHPRTNDCIGLDATRPTTERFRSRSAALFQSKEKVQRYSTYCTKCIL